ncbi:hypothetical protein Saso_51400 [Streptomyces asoensis]|uniref:Uncharacterized protein n=1 Tax=Streptomyces asoensis TaxID=249586 RepID=A0ABQ3S5U5_9ACTN|nr:hypothetical protein Saso_51400 [Streptomyces asoensis]
MVAHHDVRPADPHLALVSGGHVLPGAGVDDPDSDTGHGKAAGALDHGAVGRVDGDGPAGLGAAVGVDEGDAEGLLEGAAQSRAGDGAADETDPEIGQGEAGAAGPVDQVVVGGGDAGQEGGPVLAQGGQNVVGRTAVHDPGGGAGDGDGQDAGNVGQAVEERQWPQYAVVLGQAGHGNVARGDGEQAVALGGEDALGAAGGARGVEHPGHLVESEVVRGFVGGLGGGEFLERYGARGQQAPGVGGACHDDGHPPGDAGKRLNESLRVCRAGEGERRLAVRQEICDLRRGGLRVDRHADAAGPYHGEVTLHHRDRVAETQGHPVAAPDTEADQVTGQSPRPCVEFPVGDRVPVVLEGDLVREPARVLTQDDR